MGSACGGCVVVGGVGEVGLVVRCCWCHGVVCGGCLWLLFVVVSGKCCFLLVRDDYINVGNSI